MKNKFTEKQIAAITKILAPYLTETQLKNFLKNLDPEFDREQIVLALKQKNAANLIMYGFSWGDTKQKYDTWERLWEKTSDLQSKGKNGFVFERGELLDGSLVSFNPDKQTFNRENEIFSLAAAKKLIKLIKSRENHGYLGGLGGYDVSREMGHIKIGCQTTDLDRLEKAVEKATESVKKLQKSA